MVYFISVWERELQRQGIAVACIVVVTMRVLTTIDFRHNYSKIAARHSAKSAMPYYFAAAYTNYWHSE